MTAQGYTDPQTKDDLDRLRRMCALHAMPPSGRPMSEVEIAEAASLPLGTTLTHLRAIEAAGLACGQGGTWHRTGGEK